MALTSAQVKQKARELGADAVGITGVAGERSEGLERSQWWIGEEE